MLTLPDPNYWYCLCVWVCVVPLRPTLEHFTGTPDPPPSRWFGRKDFRTLARPGGGTPHAPPPPDGPSRSSLITDNDPAKLTPPRQNPTPGGRYHQCRRGLTVRVLTH